MTPRRLDPSTVAEKLHRLDELVGALEELERRAPEDLGGDVIARLALERALTQGVELVVAVCSHVVGATSGLATGTYRQAVEDAAAAGLLDAPLAASLARAVGLRNLLVHEYGRVDPDRLAAAVPVARHDLAAFVTRVAQWLSERP